MLFSEREGFTPAPVGLKDGITPELRVRLGNLVNELQPLRVSFPFLGTISPTILKLTLSNIFKQQVPSNCSNLEQQWWESFNNCEWSKVYDLIEYVCTLGDFSARRSAFIKHCNIILSEERAPFRFIGDKIVPITDEHEAQAVEEALAKTGPLPNVRRHLTAALQLLSDRETPNYRGSVNESISAVEALARLITQEPNSTLGDCLKALKRKQVIPGEMEAIWHRYWGFSSNHTRHAQKADGVVEVDLDLAKYFLVSCAAFVNYLATRCAGLGIELEPPTLTAGSGDRPGGPS